ncbi:MAG: hypothetical protein LBK58_11200 [Prevotellaceae bacterium]|jgi:hypothetical protein|nr:hypothetical protein [Prevotellaceae bacterium]
MGKDYIPRNDGNFLTWDKNLFTRVRTNAPRWNLSPTSWLHIDPPMITAYEDAYAKAQDPNSGMADTLEKNITRDILKKATRIYVKEFLEYNSLITDEERLQMGLPVHDPKPSPAKDPHTYPVLTTKLLAPGVIEIHAVDSESGRKAKPAGVHGFEVKMVILDVPATEWEQLTDSQFFTKTPGRISFTGKQRGKMLSLAGRWENTRGVKGPWSEIITVIIP